MLTAFQTNSKIADAAAVAVDVVVDDGVSAISWRQQQCHGFTHRNPKKNIDTALHSRRAYVYRRNYRLLTLGRRCFYICGLPLFPPISIKFII